MRENAGVISKLLLSITLQLVLAYFFGHIYDMQIAMGAGYLAGTLQNPYQHINLRQTFNSTLLWEDVPGIGYPPLAALMYGLLYRIVYGVSGDVLLYHFSLKLPVILGNILLAVYIRGILDKNGSHEEAERAFFFALFNPFILYVTVAWGQIDSLVAFLCLFFLYSLHQRKIFPSSLSLALSLAIKPLAFPLAPYAILYLNKSNRSEAAKFSAMLLFFTLILIVAPFAILGWSPAPILSGWDAHLTKGGAMGFLTFIELLYSSTRILDSVSFLGYLWVPALIGVYWLIDFNSITSLDDLIHDALIIILTFFLSRAWLSEPNMVLLLTLTLFLSYNSDARKGFLVALWALPLIFTVFNASLPQLMYLSYPSALTLMGKIDSTFYKTRLFLRTIIVLIWQITGWRYVNNLHKEIGKKITL